MSAWNKVISIALFLEMKVSEHFTKENPHKRKMSQLHNLSSVSFRQIRFTYNWKGKEVVLYTNHYGFLQHGKILQLKADNLLTEEEESLQSNERK